jgi:regulator of protease activity HflC (stomatin/prohibitin superfamily)
MGGFEIFIYALVAGIALIVVVTLVRAVRVVPQQRMDVVERLGKYHRTLKPGLNILVPFIDAVRTKVDMREQVVSFPPQPVITSDNLVVSIDTVLYFRWSIRSALPTRSPTSCRRSSSSPSRPCATSSVRSTSSGR